MKSTSPPTDLLFVVNASEQEGSAAERAQKREVHRHAQINAAIKRKHQRQKNLQPLTARRFGDLTRRDPGVSSALIPAQHVSRRTKAIPVNIQRMLSPTIQRIPGPTKMDPFNQSTTPMTPHMETVLNHYLGDLLPVIEPTAAERDDYTQWMLPLAAKEPVLIYSLVFCMSGSMEQALDGGIGPVSIRHMSKERLTYKMRAFEALQNCLENVETATQPSTLFAVHFLLWQEVRHWCFRLESD